MRFTINKEIFLKALNLVSKPVPVKSYIPSLIFIKLSLDDRGLNLVGSSDTIAISTLIEFTSNNKEIIRNYQNGAILVQGRYLTEIVRKLEGEEVIFEVLDNSIVEITDEKSSFQLNSAQADEYPEYNFNEEGQEFNIQGKELQSLIEQTSFAAATRENRPMLTAVNITGSGNTIIALALDSARYSSKIINVSKNINFVVNIAAKTINEIIKMFEPNENINIIVNQKKMLFRFANTVISSNLLNGEYPNVRNIIPKIFNYELTINAQELLNAIDRVSLLSNEKNTVRLIINNDEVQVLSTTNEVGSANEKITNFQFKGDHFEILFNSVYMIGAIKALRSEQVVLKFVGEMRPFIVKNPNNDDVTELITPVRA